MLLYVVMLYNEDGDRESREQYSIEKGEAGAVVAMAREGMGLKIARQFEFNKSGALKCVFEVARQSRRDGGDVVGMPCVRGSGGELVVTAEEEVEVWRECGEGLLNEEGDWNGELKMEYVGGPCGGVSVEDVLEVVELMNAGGTAGPGGIAVGLLRVCEEESILRLARVANDMLNGKNMPKCWKKSDLIPVYKGRGGVGSCGNCRGVELLEHGMKVVEGVFEKGLRGFFDMDEVQIGFVPGKGTVVAIFIIRQMMEGCEAAGGKLFMVFVDLKGAFDRVPGEVVWWALRGGGVLERGIEVVMEMCGDIEAAVGVESMRSELFGVGVGVHWGSVLGPLLFAVVVDEVAGSIGEGVVGEVLCADDLVLLGDNWKEVESRCSQWRGC